MNKNDVIEIDQAWNEKYNAASTQQEADYDNAIDQIQVSHCQNSHLRIG